MRKLQRDSFTCVSVFLSLRRYCVNLSCFVHNLILHRSLETNGKSILDSGEIYIIILRRRVDQSPGHRHRTEKIHSNRITSATIPVPSRRLQS